jgi:hypothetical protein
VISPRTPRRRVRLFSSNSCAAWFSPSSRRQPEVAPTGAENRPPGPSTATDWWTSTATRTTHLAQLHLPESDRAGRPAPRSGPAQAAAGQAGRRVRRKPRCGFNDVTDELTGTAAFSGQRVKVRAMHPLRSDPRLARSATPWPRISARTHSGHENGMGRPRDDLPREAAGRFRPKPWTDVASIASRRVPSQADAWGDGHGSVVRFGPLSGRLAKMSSRMVTSRMWWCASMDQCSRMRRARSCAVASALVRLVTA